VPVDNTYREVVVHGNREFQRYALENGIYFAPVDDVSETLSGDGLLI
jgi:hypothetical protein